MLHKNTSQSKLPIVPEEGWFGQPRNSTPSKKLILRYDGFCFYILHNKVRAIHSTKISENFELKLNGWFGPTGKVS